MRFKEYLVLKEATKDLEDELGKRETKHFLDVKVDPKIQAMHDKVFGVGNHHIEIPIHNSIPDVVKHHVEGNGDSIEGDKVKLKSGRLAEIGKYLGKSKAPKHIVDAHQHWDRNKGEFGNTKCVITRHKGEVASASTGTHWDSCAKAVKRDDLPGPAWEAMPHEIEHGTLMAMHIHKDAKKNKNGEYDSKDVLGRTLLKRHDSDTKEISFHPEGRSYGAVPDTMKDSVDKFTKTHYSPKSGSFHVKHEDLYDDDYTPVKHNLSATDDDLSKGLDHPDAFHRLFTLDHPNTKEHHILKALDDKDENIRRAAAMHKKGTEKTIDKGLTDQSQRVNSAAISNLKVTPKHISRVLKGKKFSPLIKKTAASHRSASSDNIHEALKSDDEFVQLNAVNNINADNSHLSKALDSKHKSVRQNAASHSRLSSENIHKAINHSDSDTVVAGVRNVNATKEHWDKVKNHKNDYVRNVVRNKLETS